MVPNFSPEQWLAVVLAIGAVGGWFSPPARWLRDQVRSRVPFLRPRRAIQPEKLEPISRYIAASIRAFDSSSTWIDGLPSEMVYTLEIRAQVFPRVYNAGLPLSEIGTDARHAALLADAELYERLKIAEQAAVSLAVELDRKIGAPMSEFQTRARTWDAAIEHLAARCRELAA